MTSKESAITLQSPSSAVVGHPASKSVTSEPYSIFDKRQKAIIVAVASVAATCECDCSFEAEDMLNAVVSGFASNIYFPAIPTIADDLSVSTDLVNLTVTSYLIFQAIAPSLWGPVSDVKGRRTAYLGTFVVFIGACIGLALTRNYATLLVLRCLQSTGSASTIAIGSGVIGDISTRAERGGYMGFFQAGLLAPVAIGPIIGGLLAQTFGWRSVFWFLTIYGTVFVLCLVVLLPETLRSIVANGSRHPSHSWQKWPLQWYQKTTKVLHSSDNSSRTASKRIDLGGPFRILVRKQAIFLLAFLAMHYAVWQMSITAMSTLFSTLYGLSERQIGLTFIANGAGSIIGTLLTGKILDKDYQQVQAKATSRSVPQADTRPTAPSHTSESNRSFPLERARLRLLPVFSLLQSSSILIFGWTISYHIHIAVPIISTFVTGWTAIAAQSAIMTYFVDVFADRSAAASASLNLARCLCAAGGTSLVGPMINGVGVGWAFTICAGVQCLSLLGLGIQWHNGGRWRDEAMQATESV